MTIPLLVLLVPAGVKAVVFYLASGWIGCFALPLLVYVGNKVQRSSDAQSEVMHQAQTHIAHAVDVAVDRLDTATQGGITEVLAGQVLPVSRSTRSLTWCGHEGAMTRSAQGEDRSGFQAEASWRGNSFGICKATEGLTFVDPTFAANWARLRAELKPRGAYHFDPGLDPVAQARFFVATVKAAGLRPPDMLVADIDIDRWCGTAPSPWPMSTPPACPMSR